MKTRKNDKHQLFTRTYTNQTTSWLVRSLSAFGARISHRQTQIHKTHYGPSGSPEIPKVGTPVSLQAHNFVCRPLINMRFEAKV
jgi:hypothetical protein